MSRRSSLIQIAAVVLVFAAAVWFGGPWLWQRLLAMHGRH